MLEFDFIYEAEDQDLCVLVDVRVEREPHPANSTLMTYSLHPRVRKVYDSKNVETNGYFHLEKKFVNYFNRNHREEALERYLHEQQSR